MRLWTLFPLSVWVAGTLVFSGAVLAEPSGQSPLRHYFSVDVGELVAEFDRSDIVSKPEIIQASFDQMDTTPHVAVPAGVEAYLLEPGQSDKDFGGYRIIGSKPVGKTISGHVLLLRRHPDQPSASSLARFDFQVAGQPASLATREDFLRARGLHALRLWSEGMAGSAVFRHLATNSLAAVGETARATRPSWQLRRTDGIDRTIRMTSGGRAVSENLQLDAQLNLLEGASEDQVAVADIRGITVRPIDWKPLLRDQPTELDSLAKLIPHDQYAVFMSSFEELAKIVDRGGELAKPMLRWLEPQSRKTDVMGFYQRQLGLPLNALTRQIGGVLIGEVAVTGSDPYFRTGTDVAILMQGDQPPLLYQSIVAQVTAQSALHRDVKKIEHKVNGHLFTQWSTVNRRFSSFVALVDRTVVVTNSLHQMRAILKAFDGRIEAMHDLEEYRFFRQRYPRGSENESALVVLTDAAIRRWCGPRWRIAASRRTRARATIADVTAEHADALVRGTVEGTTAIHASDQAPDAGTLLLTRDGVYSKKYGTLEFQTPIAELNFQYVSKGEEQMYRRWRDTYERRWRRVFDPIALQVALTDNVIDADLTVIPLVLQTEYQFLRQIIGQVRLKPGAGDPHPEELASVTMAIDTRSGLVQMATLILTQGNQARDYVTNWLDDSLTVYFDYDEDWMKRLQEGNPWNADTDDNLRDLPMGVFLPSKNNLRMTAFVMAARGAIERISPNVIRWETVKYKDFQYVVGTYVEDGFLGRAEEMPQLFYVTTPAGLTLSTNAGVIERVIDRHMVSRQTDKPVDSKQPQPPESVEPPRTGPQLVMQGTGKAAKVMNRGDNRALRRMNRLAWSNIPIMNYFRNRYPDRDPRDVYQQLFGEQLIEPTGGKYRWNRKRGTYVSTLHGFHLEPKAGPSLPETLGPNDRVRTTLSFQDGGLRATMRVEQE